MINIYFFEFRTVFESGRHYCYRSYGVRYGYLRQFAASAKGISVHNRYFFTAVLAIVVIRRYFNVRQSRRGKLIRFYDRIRIAVRKIYEFKRFYIVRIHSDTETVFPFIGAFSVLIGIPFARAVTVTVPSDKNHSAVVMDGHFQRIVVEILYGTLSVAGR